LLFLYGKTPQFCGIIKLKKEALVTISVFLSVLWFRKFGDFSKFLAFFFRIYTFLKKGKFANVFCHQVMKFCPPKNHWLQYIVSEHLSQGFKKKLVKFCDIGGVPIIQLSQF
jgi:hypothetical protein